MTAAEQTMLTTPPLSQPARVVDTFVAPSKTFADILRSTSWWLPFVLMAVLSIGSAFAVDHTIGFAAVAQQQVDSSPSRAEQIQQLPPADRAAQMAKASAITRIVTYLSPILILFFIAIEALVLWGSFNFGLGARTTFGQMFAVVMYAGLPRLFIPILSIILLYAGVNTENYNIQNPVGTNLGYFLSSSPKWMQTFGSFFDIFSLWSLALLVIGTAIIARKTKGQAAMVVIGWWVLILLIATGATAAFS